MGFSFRKSIKIAKGVTVNVGTSGVGVNVRKNGISYSLNSSGRASVSGKGTSLAYTPSKKKRSFLSSAYKKKEELDKKKADAAKAEQKMTELEENKLKVEEQETYLDMLRSIHKECDAEVKWPQVASSKAPFKPGEGPRTTEAQAALDAFQPSGLNKLFKGKAEQQKAELTAALEAAKQEDAAEYAAWEESVAFAKRMAKGDVDAYLEALEEGNPFEDFAEYGSDLEFGTERADVMEIEFRVKSEEVVPKTLLSLTKTGRLSEKDMTKTQYYDYTQDYVCSCAVRLAREIFAILPVKYVLVHAIDGGIDPKTGHYADSCILSVGFNRDGFRNINFDRIDPSDFVESFPSRMKFNKTAGFSPVERVDFIEEILE